MSPCRRPNAGTTTFAAALPVLPHQYPPQGMIPKGTSPTTSEKSCMLVSSEERALNL